MQDLDIKNISKNLKFYNFYNLDMNVNTFYSAKYYLEEKEKEENPELQQRLSTVFLDIEVYQNNKKVPFKFDESNHPVSALTFNFKKEYYCYLLHKFKEDIGQWEIDFKKELILNNYITQDENIHIFLYSDEKKLLTEAWLKIRETNPFILSGFNSDNFDYPYLYRRFLKLFNNDQEEVNNIFSQFGYVEFKDNRYLDIPEFTICDLLYLYKPREDRGLR